MWVSCPRLWVKKGWKAGNNRVPRCLKPLHPWVWFWCIEKGQRRVVSSSLRFSRVFRLILLQSLLLPSSAHLSHLVSVPLALVQLPFSPLLPTCPPFYLSPALCLPLGVGKGFPALSPSFLPYPPPPPPILLPPLIAFPPSLSLSWFLILRLACRNSPFPQYLMLGCLAFI